MAVAQPDHFFSLGFLSLKSAGKEKTRAAAYQDRATRAPNNRDVLQSENRNVPSDFAVEADCESSRLTKDFLKTRKCMERNDDSEKLGVLPDGSRFSPNPSFADFSPVLNL
jgi:hypothetical protein